MSHGMQPPGQGPLLIWPIHEANFISLSRSSYSFPLSSLWNSFRKAECRWCNSNMAHEKQKIILIIHSMTWDTGALFSRHSMRSLCSGNTDFCRPFLCSVFLNSVVLYVYLCYVRFLNAPYGVKNKNKMKWKFKPPTWNLYAAWFFQTDASWCKAAGIFHSVVLTDFAGNDKHFLFAVTMETLSLNVPSWWLCFSAHCVVPLKARQPQWM